MLLNQSVEASWPATAAGMPKLQAAVELLIAHLEEAARETPATESASKPSFAATTGHVKRLSELSTEEQRIALTGKAAAVQELLALTDKISAYSRLMWFTGNESEDIRRCCSILLSMWESRTPSGEIPAGSRGAATPEPAGIEAAGERCVGDCFNEGATKCRCGYAYRDRPLSPSATQPSVRDEG